MIKVVDIVEVPKIDDFISYDNYLTLLVHNTYNTWQKKRTTIDKTSDTKLGKQAESIVEMYIRKFFVKRTYLSYDDFRSDKFENHAPFDGLFFSKDMKKETLEALITKINNEMGKKEAYGKISDSLIAELNKNNIFTIEVKSTRVNPKRHYENEKIALQKLLLDDFLEYPFFLREDKCDDINSWDDYIKFCLQWKKDYIPSPYNLSVAKNFEEQKMRNLYVRIYIDEIFKTAYIIGCIDRHSFIVSSQIKKMVQPGKSEKALYLATNLVNGFPIQTLDS